MIKKIYADNFRCLVNFEFSPGPVSLLLGPNGSGKSSVFDLLSKIQLFLEGEGKVTDLFPERDLCRWQTARPLTFELELEGNGGAYRYSLVVEHERERGLARVQKELLFFDGKPLFEFHEGKVQLYRDDHSQGPEYSFDWLQSGLAVLERRHDNKLLSGFKDGIHAFLIVRINPLQMTAESAEDRVRPRITLDDFASWYRYLSQEHQGKVFELTRELREILDGFESFKIRKAGEVHRILELVFSRKSGTGEPHFYRFDELSDGQKVLVALYTLIHCGLADDRQGGGVLCIDEPENFLALPEIEPWFQSLYDRCVDTSQQALIISHHPKLINFLAASAGHWFDREGEGPVRVKPINDEAETGLAIDELVARGWIHG
ncbi:MAG: AAA family ATPase [Desulfomonilaceae bacterium]|nr:AAA family ATPase [Desulfomonilaceae bacterium]